MLKVKSRLNEFLALSSASNSASATSAQHQQQYRTFPRRPAAALHLAPPHRTNSMSSVASVSSQQQQQGRLRSNSGATTSNNIYQSDETANQEHQQRFFASFMSSYSERYFGTTSGEENNNNVGNDVNINNQNVNKTNSFTASATSGSHNKQKYLMHHHHNIDTTSQQSNNNNADDDEDNEVSFWPPAIYIDFTEDYALAKVEKKCGGNCISSFLFAHGYWPQDVRTFNRRFSSIYASYTLSGSKWCPLASAVFLFVVAIVAAVSSLSTSDNNSANCAINLLILGALHALFAIVFLLFRPARQPLDNIFIPLQYIAAGVIAFSRSSIVSSSEATNNGESDFSRKTFLAVLVLVLVSLTHYLLQTFYETLVLGPAEFMRYKTIDENEDRIVQDVEDEMNNNNMEN